MSNTSRRTAPPELLKMAMQVALDEFAVVGNIEGSLICVNYAGNQ